MVDLLKNLNTTEPKSIKIQLLLGNSVFQKIRKDADKYNTKDMLIVRAIIEQYYNRDEK